MFKTLKQALAKTAQSLLFKPLTAQSAENSGKFTPNVLEEALEALEDKLIRADVGIDLASLWVEELRKEPQFHAPQGFQTFLKLKFHSLLRQLDMPYALMIDRLKLNIIFVTGVNGAGKTTLIGKLAFRLKAEGHHVLIAAADTYRAAAEDQLTVWAERAEVDIIRRDHADPASIIFDAIKHAKAEQHGIILIDTAGRLQNKFNLIEELRKMRRIIEEQAPEATLEKLLVLDATTGQNAMSQAQIFHDAIGLTGIALTKLDGSAKGGIVFNIAQTYQLPVKLMGTGEKISDLEVFEPDAFVEALFTE
jgi:fused signal recognition particle receptor